MKVFNTKVWLLAATGTICLTACGGVGAGDLVSVPQKLSPADQMSLERVPVTDVQSASDLGDSIFVEPAIGKAMSASTSELKATKSFDFSTQRQLDVDFRIAAAKGNSGFLSVCSDYTFDGESSYDVDYDKCSLRATITNGELSTSLNVSNDVAGLLGVIWFIDDETPPLFNEFDITSGQEEIVWR